MIGGGHVRRLSIGSLEGSPCVRIEKEKRMMSHIKGIKGVNLADRLASMREVTEEPESSPRIVEKPSTSSFQFGDDRMEQARKGVLKRDSLEMGCLSADGEDTSLSCKL
jgi:serine/arginine repetitive matrix protein 2